MLAEIIAAIALLCQSPTTGTNGSAIRQQNKECTAKYLSCIRSKKNVSIDDALERCIAVDKLDL